MNSFDIDPADVSPAVGGYRHGVLAQPGRMLFISGQIPTLPSGEVPSGFEAQCRAVWDNVGRVLRDAGGSFPSLVKVTTFLTHPDQANVNGDIRRHYLGDHAPALTVVVASTLDSSWLLEIEAIAVIS